MNLFHDKLKLSERFVNSIISNISILDADILQDQKMYIIFSLVKANDYFFLTKFTIDQNFKLNLEIIEDIFNINNKDILNLYKEIKTGKLFLNKLRNEFYLILSTTKNSIIFFFSSEIPHKGMCYKKSNYPINGVSSVFYNNKFVLNILFNLQSIFQIFFDVKSNKINYNDISDTFYKGLMYNNLALPTSISKEFNLFQGYTKYNEDVDDMQERSILPDAAQILISSDAQLCSKQDFEKKKNLQEKIIYFINSKLKKFYEYKTNSETQHNITFLYDLNLDVDELTSNILELKQSMENVDEFPLNSSIEIIIKNIVDNETLNINNINNESLKAESIIIEYLIERSEKYEIFFSFLNEFKIFQNFDENNLLFSLCLSYKEKLFSAIKLRELENSLLSNYTSIKPSEIRSINLSSTQKMVIISHDFLEATFKKYKDNKNNKNEKKNQNLILNKYSVYLNISKFDEYLRFIMDEFTSKIKDLTVKMEDNLFLSYNFLYLWNSIFSVVKQISSSEENNFVNCLWLIEKKEDFLEKLEKLFEFMLVNYNKDGLLLKENFDFKKMIIDYVDYLLHFYKKHYIFKAFPGRNFEYEKKKRFLIRNIIEIDYEKSLCIAIKYQSLNSIGYICHKCNCPEKLKEYLDTLNYNESGKDKEYLLKVYLVLEIEKKINAKNLKCENFHFDFFDIFSEYQINLLNIFINFPKVNFYYKFYLKSKEGNLDLNYYQRNISIEDFENIEILINSINSRETLENVFKMLRYIINVDESNRYQNNLLNEKEFREMDGNYIKKIREKINFYNLHYNFVNKYSLISDNEKYSAGCENILVNFFILLR